MKRILVFLFLGLGRVVWTCDDGVLVTEGGTCTIECDNQQNYDCFRHGTRKVDDKCEQSL